MYWCELMGFCNNITQGCEVCYEAIYGECNDVITFSLGLTGNTTFFLSLIDKFDIVTQLTVTTDVNGDFDITQTWTEFFGAVEVQIFSDVMRNTRVLFTVNSISFECIVLDDPSVCDNKLDFSESCNSQYLTL